MIWNITLFIIPLICLALILWYEEKEHGDTAMVWFTIMCSMWALAAFV